jgi:uncharacterized protein
VSAAYRASTFGPEETGIRAVTVAFVSATDDVVEQMLSTYDTITVVGASATPSKAAHSVPLHMQEHGWRIIPVNPHAASILGEPVYQRLADVPEQVGLVDVFRPSAETADVARQAIAVGATALWLQLGIRSEEARAIAEAAGMLYVEDRCLIIEQRRLGREAPTLH